MDFKRIFFILASICLLCFGLGKINFPRELWTQDENDMASLTVAMVHDQTVWLRPTYHPFVEHADGQLGQGIVAPPLANVLMAIPSLLGIQEAWTFPLLQAILLISGMVFFAQKIARCSVLLALGAVSLCITLSPRLMVDILTLKPDVALTGFAIWGIAFAFPLYQESKGYIAILSGLFIGLAFLSKLWLIIPVGLATLFIWISYLNRWKWTTIFLISALTVSFSHLFLVLLFDPQTFSRWWHEVYFSIFSQQGVASTKWAGVTDHPEWSHGMWYYPFAIVREIGFATPLAIYGFILAFQGDRRKFVWALSAGLLLGLVILSVPIIKEPLYVLSIVAVGTTFSAYGLIVFLEKVTDSRWILAFLIFSFFSCLLLVKQPKVTIPQTDERRPLLFLR